jgi:hypothetical protein
MAEIAGKLSLAEIALNAFLVAGELYAPFFARPV